MARSNWDWIDAVNPPDTMAGFRSRRIGRYGDRRLGSFWDRKVAGQFRPAFDQNGNQLNNAGGRGKVVDSVPHTQAVKGIVIDPVTGEQKVVMTG